MALTPQDATAAEHAAFGRHPGFRALHAKGIVLAGTFAASPEAPRLTRAAHLQGEPVPVTARFSNGGGNPDVSDAAPDVRGLAVKFYLPDGARTDIVAQTAPRFPVRTPEAFVEMIRALGAGPRAPIAFGRFLARHPEAVPKLAANAGALRPPRSYASVPYFAVHAYRFLDASGGARFGRYTLVPEQEQPRLWPHQARGRSRDFLQDELRSRLDQGPVRFSLQLQIAGPGDAVDDPSARWPATRERVTLGTVQLTDLDSERETCDDVLVFDPSRVTDGIELSDDPVLRFRPAAYSDSIRERTEAR
jgi:catalase